MPSSDDDPSAKIFLSRRPITKPISASPREKISMPPTGELPRAEWNRPHTGGSWDVPARCRSTPPLFGGDIDRGTFSMIAEGVRFTGMPGFAGAGERTIKFWRGVFRGLPARAPLKTASIRAAPARKPSENPATITWTVEVGFRSVIVQSGNQRVALRFKVPQPHNRGLSLTWLPALRSSPDDDVGRVLG